MLSNGNPGEHIATDSDNTKRPGTEDAALISAANSRAPIPSIGPTLTDQRQRRRSFELLLDLLVMEARLQGWAIDFDSDRGLEDNLSSNSGTEAADLTGLATHQLFQDLVRRYRLQERKALFERLGALVLHSGDPEMVNRRQAEDEAECTEPQRS